MIKLSTWASSPPENRYQWRIYIVRFSIFFVFRKISPNNRESWIRPWILCRKDFQLALSFAGWMESWETRPRLKREPERSDLDLKETTSSFKPNWISRSQEQEENEERAAVDVPASEPNVTWQWERCEGATQGFPQCVPVIPGRTHVRKVSVDFILVFSCCCHPPTKFSAVSVCLTFCSQGGSPYDHYPWCIGSHCTETSLRPLAIALPPSPGHGSSLYRDPLSLLVTFGDQEWRPVQTCSREDTPTPYAYKRAVHILLECFLVIVCGCRPFEKVHTCFCTKMDEVES